MAAYYPVYLNLVGRRCVVFGGGAVAEGKIPNLLDAGACVTVISPEATQSIQRAAQRGDLDWQAREYQPGDLQGVFLGIAATNVRQVNREISREAEQLGVILNVVDDPPLCTFIAPSIVRRGPVTLAISTGGASPALARKLREELSADPVLEWADLAEVLSRARMAVKKRCAVVDPDRWQCSITEEALRLAQAGREAEGQDLLISSLLDAATPALCPDVARCRPGGCQIRPKSQAADVREYGHTPLQASGLTSEAVASGLEPHNGLIADGLKAEG